MGGSPLSILNNIVKFSDSLPKENSCKYRYYENSLFFFHRNDDDWGVGYYYVACLARNYLQCRPTNKFVGWGCTLFYWLCYRFDACRKQRKKEEEEERQAEQDKTNELMREYLKKKLQEENDKQ